MTNSFILGVVKCMAKLSVSLAAQCMPAQFVYQRRVPMIRK